MKLKNRAEKWGDLTPRQQTVVKWIVDNSKEPRDAFNEGIVAGNTLYAVWTVVEVERWMDLYRDFLHTQRNVEERVEEGVQSLADEAIAVMRDTLASGAGNPTAVRAAQWVLTQIIEAKSARENVKNGPATAEDELAAVLRLVK
jgi:hypothetical protein